MASSESPKANATPTNPMWLPASTALPTPPNTSTKVPRNSARYFRMGGSPPSESAGSIHHVYKQRGISLPQEGSANQMNLTIFLRAISVREGIHQPPDRDCDREKLKETRGGVLDALLCRSFSQASERNRHEQRKQ